MHYFNAFFTLALDEAIMVGVDFLRRRGMFAEDSPIRNGLGQVFLMASHLAISMVWRFLNWMDRPWLKRGLSNGFLVLALREPFPEQAVASEPAVAQLRGPLAPLSLAAASTEFPGGS
jgi:hypothetical protein